METLLVLLVLSPVYCVPSIVAWARQCASTGGILVLNTFLGWTLVGWVAALIWAAAGVRAVGHSGAMRVWDPPGVDSAVPEIKLRLEPE